MNTFNSMRSLVRAILVIKSFAPDELELGGADIARKVGIPKTTAHRILACLTENGLLDQNAKTGKYMIGPELYVQGALYLSSTDVLKAAQPVSEALNDLTGEAVSLGIHDKGNVILIMRDESKHIFRIARHIGSVIPAYASSMGKALLSQMSAAEIDSLYPEERLRPLTKKTITTKTELKLELGQIRKTGVAFNREESYEGVDAVASVIRNASGGTVSAISISVPIFRIDQADLERLGILVSMGSSLISYRLGYQNADGTVHDIQEIHSWWEQSSSDSVHQGKQEY